MEALKLSFPQSISPAAKKTAVPAQQDQALFASLLTSMSTTEAESPSDEQPPEEQVMEGLESVLAFLQELPVEEQTAEQEELQYAILHLQELKAGTVQVTAASQANRSLTEAAEASAKLIEALENVQQKLQVLSSLVVAESTASSVKKEAAAQTHTMNFTDLPEISKQLDKLIGVLEKEQQKAAAAQPGKSIGPELPVEGAKLVNELPRFLTETLKPVKELPKAPLETQGTLQQTDAVELEPSVKLQGVEELRSLNDTLKPVKELSKAPVETQEAVQEAEAVDLQPSVKLQGTEELQSPKVSADSKPAQEPTVQPTAGAAAEMVKAAGTQIRTEAHPPAAPFVRLPNLLEDLGGMLKSSMRMAETAEGMKMRVNIFPEHLGHLEILLTSTNGKLAAQIMASTPMAKEALELQLNQLRASLVQQGVAVEKIEVLQQNSQQPFSQQHSHAEQRFSQQSRNGTGRQEKNGYLQPEEEKAGERQPSVGHLMKVDYTV